MAAFPGLAENVSHGRRGIALRQAPQVRLQTQLCLGRKPPLEAFLARLLHGISQGHGAFERKKKTNTYL